MRKTLQCRLLLVLSLVHLVAAATAGPVFRYTCEPVPQPKGGCNGRCQQELGTALLQLHAGLKGAERNQPWHGEHAVGLCKQHCHAVPAYCGWPGVLCCHTQGDTRPHNGSTHCRYTDVEHELCPGKTAPGAVWKLDLTMQQLGGSLTDDVVDALKVLTGLGLHAIDFSSNNLSGTIPARLSELGPNFTTINLNFNKLTGTIPRSISQLPNLQHVYFSFNKLNGSLGGRFCTRGSDPLEVLILRSNYFTGTADLTACKELLLLDLTDNQFTGSLPVGIQNSKLVSLRATNNLFTGSINDDIWKIPMLTTVDLGNNELNGSLSVFVGTSNNLVNIYLGNNSLSGTLPVNIATNSQLLVLELQNNTNLHGTFPSVGALVGLRRLDIHNTSLNGSIPVEWGQLPYLEYVDISGTRMSCCETQAQADSGPTLPPFLQFSKRFAQFDLNTPSWGARVLDDVDDASSNSHNILCRTVVRKPQPEAVWNLLHLPTISNVVDSQRWQVSPLYFWFDECTCTKFQDKSGSSKRYTGVDQWCDADYNSQPPRNISPGPCLDMSIFVCEPLTRTLPPGVRAAIAVASFMFAVIVLGIVAYFVLAKASKFRRYLTLAGIRLKGAPRSGRMSLVVTDIEGYSDIFRRSPEVMFKALVLHNSVLRAAKYYNGGFVMEQEGDSFTIAFYSSFDAVVFCLQAQQALLAVQWPPGLEQVQNPDISNHTDPGGSRKGSKLHMRLSPLLGFGPKLKRVNTNNSARSMGSHADYQHSISPSTFYSAFLQGLGSKDNFEPVLFNGLRVRMGVVTGDIPSGTSIKNSALFQLAKVVGDFGNGGQIILDEATFLAVKDDAQALGAVDASGINHRRLSSGRSCWNKLLRMCGCVGPHAPAEEVVVLDMGAFCHCRSGDDTELPYTTSRALDVKQPDTQQPDSPQAWWPFSRQPCSPCCGRKSEGSLSGDASDQSPRQSPSPLPPAAQMSRPYLLGPQRTRTHSSVSFGVSSAAGSAGDRSLASTSKQQQQLGHLQEGPDTAPKQDTGAGRLTSFSARAGRQIAELRKSLARSQSFQGGQAAARRDWESVRLYQVLPPALAARAHVWHNQLNLKDGWICWDNLYFEAPGSTSAPLTGGNLDIFGSPSSCSQLQPTNSRLPAASALSPPASPPGISHTPPPPAAAAAAGYGGQHIAAAACSNTAILQVQHTGDSDCSGASLAAAQPIAGFSSSGSMQAPEICSPLMQPLPPVTMVFMAVEGPEQLVRRRRTFTPRVQVLLSRVVRDALRRLGGYLCRVQEGDMKFMVAFASPVTALEWCLLVQTSAMYLAWPQAGIMLLPSCKEQVDSSGRLVFRGPRLKMGVCEGVPRSILPDHEGRADYHGQSINMAARFMDKGARGGQIACTRELAEQVMAVWALGGSSSSFTGLHTPLQVTHSIAEHQDTSDAAAGAADQAATAGAVSSGHGLQPLDIDLPPEQAPAAAAADAAASGSSGGGSKSRFWWSPFASTASPSSTAGAPAGAAGVQSSCNTICGNGSSCSAAAGPAAASVLGPHATASSASAPLTPLQLSSSPGSGRRNLQDSTVLQGGTIQQHPPSSTPAGALSPGYAGPVRAGSRVYSPRSQLDTATSPLGTGGGSTAAAGQHAKSAAGVLMSQAQEGRVVKQRAAGGSWPDGLPSQQQQGPEQQQRHPRLAAHLWLSHSSSSQDGSGQPAQRSSSRVVHGARTLPPVLQGQPSVACWARSQPPPVPPSPFVMSDVVRVPFSVEVHRLGLFSFKGGPPQQEMVQVLPTHLLGRMQFISADAAQPSSRKGQLLQALEGRLGRPLTVQLPVLAQEYHERLSDRVSGHTGLPHRCTSPGAQAAPADAPSVAHQLRPEQGGGPDVFGSSSVSLPVRGSEGLSGAAAGHPAAAAAAGGLQLAGVHSDPASHCSAARAAGAGLCDTAASRQQSNSSMCSHISLAINLEPPNTGASAQGAVGDVAQEQLQQHEGQQAIASSVEQGEGKLLRRGSAGAGATGTAAVTAARETCVVDMPDMVLRHDSFGSVGGDEESGLMSAVAAVDGDGGLRSKSDPQFVRPPRRSSRQGDPGQG